MFKKTSSLVPWGFLVIDNKKIVIIGCSAGGGTAAQFARKTDRKATITIFEKGKYPQYSKCGLPYAISGEIPEFNHLIEFTKEWFEKEKINLFLDTTVEHIDNQNKCVIIKKDNKEIKYEYDKLIIATGAKPLIPPIQNILKKGELLEGVYTLRTLDDGKQISSQIKKNGKAIVVGAGLIGLEMASCLYNKGMEVSVIEALPTILSGTIDEDMSKPIQKQINEKITIYTNHLAMKAEERQGKIKSLVINNTETNEEKQVHADMVVLAVGTKPEVSLAENIGCTIGKTGGIVVNQQSETSVQNVYAVGDCTEYTNFVTKDQVLVGLGSIVVRQGIAAGINAAGGQYTLPEGFLLTCTSEFFDIEIAAVGPVKNNCLTIPIVYGKMKGLSIPEYFPGGKEIAMKVGIHEETGKILSAQAVGNNAAQRINTMACAILNKVHVEDFKKLETAYAPPIAPTLDVVTLVCDVASLKWKKMRKRL